MRLPRFDQVDIDGEGLVADDAMFMRNRTPILAANGYEVIEASNGEEGKRYFEEA